MKQPWRMRHMIIRLMPHVRLYDWVVQPGVSGPPAEAALIHSNLCGCAIPFPHPVSLFKRGVVHPVRTFSVTPI